MFARLRQHLKNKSFWNEPGKVKSNDWPQDVYHVRRLHPRYGPLVGIAYFNHPATGYICIDNISYGGALLVAVDPAIIKGLVNESGELSGELCMLGYPMPCVISPTEYRCDRSVSCSFVHSDQSIILFLRKYLDYIRIGAGLRPQEPNGYLYSNSAVSMLADDIRLVVNSQIKDHEFVIVIRHKPPIIDTFSGEGDVRNGLETVLCLLLGFKVDREYEKVAPFASAIIDYLDIVPHEFKKAS